MKIQRWLPAVLVVAAAGCILTSGQFVTSFELGDFLVTTAGVTDLDVDLNTIEDYADHKENLQGLADVAILGQITNTGSTDIDVVAYLTPNLTDYTTATQVTQGGIQVWGPLRVAAGTTLHVDWDRSAALFTAAGKATLVAETKGDGNFTVYIIGAAGTYSFSVDDGQLVLVLDAGL